MPGWDALAAEIGIKGHQAEALHWRVGKKRLWNRITTSLSEIPTIRNRSHAERAHKRQIEVKSREKRKKRLEAASCI